mgnify:CR=1 FL=1
MYQTKIFPRKKNSFQFFETNAAELFEKKHTILSCHHYHLNEEEENVRFVL